MKAARNGQIDTVQTLVRQDPTEVMRQDKNGKTVLTYAIASGHVSLIPNFISFFARRSDVLLEINLALSNLAYDKKIDIINALIMMPGVFEQKEALHTAIEFKLIDTVKSLCTENPGLLAEKDEHGKTSLMQAAESDAVEILQFIIEQNICDVNEKDKQGKTALMYAAESNNAQAVEMLINAGAEVKAINNDGDDALILSLLMKESHEFAVAQQLIAAGADVNLINNQGVTALQIATKDAQTRTIEAINEAIAEKTPAQRF